MTVINHSCMQVLYLVAIETVKIVIRKMKLKGTCNLMYTCTLYYCDYHQVLPHVYMDTQVRKQMCACMVMCYHGEGNGWYMYSI